MDTALLDQLEMEHRQVEELFAKLEQTASDAEQRPLVEELVSSLTKHMEVEESDVYPEVLKIDAEMEQEAETEHRDARVAMGKVQEMIGTPGFGEALTMLQAGVAHHVEEEEGEVFPKLREALGYPTR